MCVCVFVREGVYTPPHPSSVERLDAPPNTSQAKVDTEQRDRDGATVLLQAARANQWERVRVLADAGADLNAQDNAGMTTFMRAVRESNRDVAQWLLDCGVDMWATTVKGTSAYLQASLEGKWDMVSWLADRPQMTLTRLNETDKQVQTTPPPFWRVRARARCLRPPLCRYFSPLILVVHPFARLSLPGPHCHMAHWRRWELGLDQEPRVHGRRSLHKSSRFKLFAVARRRATTVGGEACSPPSPPLTPSGPRRTCSHPHAF